MVRDVAETPHEQQEACVFVPCWVLVVEVCMVG